MNDLPQTLTRRRMLSSVACGFGSMALAGLCSAEAAEATDAAAAAARGNPLAPRPPVVPARAKRVIFLFMQGGPSHVDTYDPKPLLQRDHGKQVPIYVARTRETTPRSLLASPFKFGRHGQCGRWVSELFPETARHVDDLCFLQGVHTQGVAHGPATLALHTGATSLIRPSVGSWITYGLGTANRNLPGFVTISPTANMGGPRNYSNAFLPAVYQGTTLGRAEAPPGHEGVRHLKNPYLSPPEQRRQLDYLRSLNEQQLRQSGAGGRGDRELEAAIESFELAFRMQGEAPQLLDLAGESIATKHLYGIGEPATDEFGRRCLLARRLAEAGVRYVQVNYSDNGNNPKWDQHADLGKHAGHARATDRPVAGLLADLKSRGMLEDTLVWWGGEFGRTPFSENETGRDHNPDGFTVWLAGGGVKPGFSYGSTDELGLKAVTDKVHMHDLHATVLHLLGLDHERLTFRYAGRDFRLTDVYGRVVREIIA